MFVRNNKKATLTVVFTVLLVVLCIALAAIFKELGTKSTTSNLQTQSATQTVTESIVGLQLDTNKQYGNKYANGLLPVGDKKVTTQAKKGYVFSCQTNFVSESQAGAQVRGPWFVNNNTQWDINKKTTVSGSINWDNNLTMAIANGKRTITTNDLPDHHTGTFPVAKTDPAYNYDRNPNTIKSQSLTYTLTESPSYGNPQCMGNEAGVMTSGSALFNAFDAGGRDAGAWEVQDSCDGHPQVSGEYHYHTLSRCVTDVSVQTVIGYALDGFAITGPKLSDQNILTTDDLDECHGIVSEIMLDGKKTKTYHYVMTQDFPYSVSCFRATPTKSAGAQAGSPPQSRRP
jgi:hypothetical protein